ncbi:flagellar biosynthesis protein FlhF [Salipaludibacillus keqinensis]|uniref:Flagellar biosynthesis protein FlhF n=1 Tax=Salipaludibacillus keqinensis TaxID=2045207 RepID=A0A323TDH5_9BACI|nr:flagellar biosynthesis protein FlhF [Salipaludibacillus keqinensis]PYZ93129.1 flagellar biosynthesis protein FlhF [Salipaludibacillus keqinensis]
MKIKKYLAKDMSEAMTKIRAELGQDAVILNSKRVETGGFLGFFTKKNMEVIAAIDPENRPLTSKRPIVNKQKQAMKPKQDTVKLTNEINELKNMIKELHQGAPGTKEDYPSSLDPINRRLVDQEVSDSYRMQVMKQLLKRWYQEDGDSKSDEEIEKWMIEQLTELLVDKDFGSFNYSKKYLNVVGPTGVGKTTTLAKIAAKAVLHDQKKVAFITTDTFRIAAIEQLKTYAKILDVPMEVAYSMKDFKEALSRFSDYDFVLIDSAGRNFRNPLYVEQLNQVIDFNEEMETHLVLAMTSKYRDMSKIIEQFKLIHINKFIFTKLDETDSVGAMLNVMVDFGIGASYLATGQNVPDDIEEATTEKVIERLVRR